MPFVGGMDARARTFGNIRLTWMTPADSTDALAPALKLHDNDQRGKESPAKIERSDMGRQAIAGGPRERYGRAERTETVEAGGGKGRSWTRCSSGSLRQTTGGALI